MTSRLIPLAAVVVGLFVAFVPQSAHAQGPNPTKIRVQVTDSGFSPDTVEVQQGQAVELTFVWAQQTYPNDEHIIDVDGYHLEADQIDSTHREATVKFVADKAGTFAFHCDLDCEAHNYLQAGHLKVSSGSVGNASLTPTQLSIAPSSWATPGDPILLMAVLKDEKGLPVSKAEVQFSLDAQFAGVNSSMAIGTAKTDGNGVAFLMYQPTVRSVEQKISAQFDGMGMYAQSAQSIQVRMIDTPPSAYQMTTTGLPDMPVNLAMTTSPASPASAALSWGLGHWQEVPLVALIGCVWGAFAFVLLQVFRIAVARAD